MSALLGWIAAIGCVYALISAMGFLVSAIVQMTDGDYLVDVSKTYIAVTFLPIGWPFYIVSWLRRKSNRNDDEDNTTYLDGELTEYIDDDDFYGSWHTRASDEELQSAQALYHVFRSNNALETLRRKKSTAENRLYEVNEELKAASEVLRTLQKERQEATIELREASELLEAREAGEAAKAEELEAEFERIRNLKGVRSVRIKRDRLSVLVQGSIDYLGTTYDLGEWELRIHPDSAYMESERKRSPMRKSWEGGYPNYKLSDGRFCFGNVGYTIEDNLRKGQYLQAIELAVACINSVNYDDMTKIPVALKKLKERQHA